MDLKMFRLIRDNNSHWYVINAFEEDHFWQWVEAEETGLECKFDFNDCRVDGPHTILFPSYKDTSQYHSNSEFLEHQWEHL